MTTALRARRATVLASQMLGVRQLDCWRIGPIAITESSLGDFHILAASCGLAIVKGIPAKKDAFRLAREILRDVPASEWPPLYSPDPQSPNYTTPEYIVWKDRVCVVLRRWFAVGGGHE